MTVANATWTSHSRIKQFHNQDDRRPDGGLRHQCGDDDFRLTENYAMPMELFTEAFCRRWRLVVLNYSDGSHRLFQPFPACLEIPDYIVVS